MKLNNNIFIELFYKFSFYPFNFNSITPSRSLPLNFGIPVVASPSPHLLEYQLSSTRRFGTGWANDDVNDDSATTTISNEIYVKQYYTDRKIRRGGKDKGRNTLKII